MIETVPTDEFGLPDWYSDDPAPKPKQNNVHDLGWSSRFDEAKIPPRFHDAHIDDLTGEIGDRARDLVERFPTIDGLKEPSGVFVSGATGSGKTHALVAILKKLIAQGSSGRFADTTGLFLEIKDSFNQRGYDSPLDELMRVDVLLLDDLGAGHAFSAWEHEQIYGLINHRYNEGSATLITSNLKFGDDLAACIGDRAASRIGQMCEVWAMGADARDRRNPKTWPAS